MRAVEFHGTAGYAAGTGYTGEDGVELHVAAEAAPEVWRTVLGAGVTPAGLGARDTLRLEAGLPLHGHELGPGITPLQAGLGWVVRWDKGRLPRPRRPRRRARARRRPTPARAPRRRAPDPARRLRRSAIEGETAGEVTSGNFSPVLERGIALAFLPPDVAEGTAVSIDVRGRAVDASVVPTPFVVKH